MISENELQKARFLCSEWPGDHADTSDYIHTAHQIIPLLLNEIINQQAGLTNLVSFIENARNKITELIKNGNTNHSLFDANVELSPWEVIKLIGLNSASKIQPPSKAWAHARDSLCGIVQRF